MTEVENAFKCSAEALLHPKAPWGRTVSSCARPGGRGRPPLRGHRLIGKSKASDKSVRPTRVCSLFASRGFSGGNTRSLDFARDDRVEDAFNAALKRCST